MGNLVNSDSSSMDKQAIEDNEIFTHKLLESLEKEYGTSFYFLNLNKLRDNFHKINNAFKSRYSHFIIGYSYKTNYLPYLCKELDRLGAYAEVVSKLEYDLALKIGVDPRRIIFNGPVKSKEDLFSALKNESIVNLDSIYEIDFVKEYAIHHQNTQIKVGLRLNFDISKKSEKGLFDGLDISRFGFCVENGSFELALSELSKLSNVQVVGLHGHFTTRNRTLDSYKIKTQTLCRLAKKHLSKGIEFIDIGGGIYGEVPKSFQIDVPSFDDYAEVICETMNREFDGYDNKPALILEPGVAMVANTFQFAAKVIENKKIQEEHFVVVDGSIHNIKPVKHRFELPLNIIRKEKETSESSMFHIVGYTCMEKDYLAANVTAVIPEKDDYILFDNVGAYTIVLAPPFIKERPSIIAIDNQEVFVVRKKETVDQFFSEELYLLG